MAGGPRFEAFFLSADPGARFALFCPPLGSTVRGGILYAHPFAEEMNKSRRMAALQAREFAKAGFAVLLIDLYGCGDSSGDFAEARWEIWKRDLAIAAAWLSERIPGPLHLWGLRLGCMLALDAWREQPSRFTSAMLWQPVINGAVYMTQFLRLAVAGEALREATGKGVTTDGLRRLLSSGESVEVAGYELAPELAGAIDSLNLIDLKIPASKVHWFEVKTGNVTEPSTTIQRVLTGWQEKGGQIDYRAVQGDPFWTTQEIAEAPNLIAVSTARYSSLAA
jgi:exosortase A-associated hydrolase 2